MTDKFAELEHLRRDRDWTYKELGEAIERATLRRRDPDCWRKICQGLTDAPHARTIAILDTFFASIHKQPQSRRKVS